MYPLQLQSEVRIRAPNFWGLNGELIFRPTQATGWWWSTGNDFVPIIPAIIDNKVRRLRLLSGNKKLEVYEHIGVLRWFGLCQVAIKSSSSWPPHFGSGLALWRAIEPFCSVANQEEIPWYTVKEPIRWEYPELRHGLRAFTEILPNDKPMIELDVTYSYPGVGTGTRHFCLPDNGALKEICTYPSQGLSWGNYYLSLVATFFGWPNHNAVTWRQEYAPEETLRRFILHRAADLLGGLSLLCQDGLLAARVVSHCSGHKADTEVVLKARSLLRYI